MTDNLISSIAAIVTAIIGLAVLAVIVSRNSNTTGVISASASGLATALGAAEAPITGSSFSGFTGGLNYGIGSPLG